MLYPLTFRPILKERIWGGRNLELLFQKPLPPGLKIGESWEISDRPGDESIVINGPLAGTSLRGLMEEHSAAILGKSTALGGRFPLLVKILDAQDKLSLQVHPPPARAVELHGEPKTEMWHIVHAQPGAELFVGLKHGVTRAEFERRIATGSVQECFHRLAVHAGDTMFLPSGRVHAIGAGNVIFEIQQNSDTTYRVFDWNRVDTQGKPRELHIPESLASIDFEDFEPAPVKKAPPSRHANSEQILVDDPLFQVTHRHFQSGTWPCHTPDRPVVLGIIHGSPVVKTKSGELPLKPGGFCLIPACVTEFQLACAAPVELLWVVPG